jgi:hypothetical protein
MPDRYKVSSHRSDRLRSAWLLVKAGGVERVGPTQFRVAGNVEKAYDVDLMGDPTCYCRDMEHRGEAIKNQCKHTLAARLAQLDESLLGTIAEWLDKAEVVR